MNAYELVEYLESLPQEGIVEWDIDGDSLYSSAKDAHYTAVSDTTLRMKANVGFGAWSQVESDMMLDCDEIRHVRHVRNIPR